MVLPAPACNTPSATSEIVPSPPNATISGRPSRAASARQAGGVARRGREDAVELAQPLGQRADQLGPRRLAEAPARAGIDDDDRAARVHQGHYYHTPMLGGSLSVGILLAFGTSVCWALTNVAVARSGQMVGPMRGLLWAEVFGGVLAAVAGWAFDGPTQAFTFGTAGWLLVAGVSSLAGYLCMFYALVARAAFDRRADHVGLGGDLDAAVGGRSWASRCTPRSSPGSVLVVAGIAMVSRHARPSESDGHADADAGGQRRTPRGPALGLGVAGRRARLRRADPFRRAHRARDRPPGIGGGGVRHRHRAGAAARGPVSDRPAPAAARRVAVGRDGRPAGGRRLRLHRARQRARPAGGGVAAGQPVVGADRDLRLGRAARAPASGRAGRRGAGLRRGHHRRFAESCAKCARLSL